MGWEPFWEESEKVVSTQGRALWRTRVRPWWRDARPFVVAGLVVLTIVLGTIGFHRLELPDHIHYGFWDSLWRALRLFGFEGTVEPVLPWQLVVAGIIGPLLTGYAAVLALLRLSRRQVQLMSLRLFGRDHVVIAGLGLTGTRLAHAFHAGHHRVVAIDVDEEAIGASGCEERSIPVLVGNAADTAVLDSARAGRARHIIVDCGEDGTNVDVAIAAQLRVDERRRRGVLSIFVHLNDLRLWRKLSAEAVATEHPHTRLQYFNVVVTGTQILAERHPPFLDPTGAIVPTPHICIVGLEEVGENLLLHTAGAWRNRDGADGSRLRVTVTGPDADVRLDDVLARHPELRAICDLDARPAQVAAPALQSGEILLAEDGTSDIDRIYVCLPRASEVLSVSLGLHRHPASQDVPLVAVIDDADTGVGRALRAQRHGYAQLSVFGLLDAALTPELLLHGTTELIARAKHADYVRHEQARGITAADNPSMAAWEDLPESLRDSNRRFADGVAAKLRATGCTLVPAPLLDAAGPLFRFTATEVEDLARQEHDRWARDLERDGWRPTDGAKDPERKLHPLLVPWSELPEAERDKDREPVRALPRLLARAGLEIRRTHDAAPEPGALPELATAG